MKQQYGLDMLDMQKCCDSCGAKFSIEHALVCKKGVLGVGCHNEVNTEIGIYTPTHPHHIIGTNTGITIRGNPLKPFRCDLPNEVIA